MPIRPENKARYPKDWPQISASIKERAGHKCEECGIPNYEKGGRAPDGTWHKALPTGTNGLRTTWPEPGELAWCEGYTQGRLRIVRIVLTTAHLREPAHFPFFYHVTRNAVADQVGELIGFCVPSDPESPEWLLMMHNRATTEFLGRFPTRFAGFFIPLPCGTARGTPARPVVFGSLSASPIWVEVTGGRLLGKPFEPTNIATETAFSPKIKSTLKILHTAALANEFRETALNVADVFTATFRRTRPPVISRLLCSERESHSASNTTSFGRTFSGSAHGLIYHMDDYPENCSPSNLKALCQKCHNSYDSVERRKGTRMRAKAARAAGDLFG